MASRSLGTLTVDLVAKTGGFVQGMDKAERSSKKWKKSVENDLNTISKTAKTTALAIGTTLVGSVTALTVAGLKSVDAQAKFAKSLNTTFDSVSQLNRAFQEAGIEGYESSLNRLNRRLGAAELGRGAGLNAVKELNLDLKELASMNAADRVAMIADRIKAVATNSQTAARYAQDLGFEQKEAAEFFMRGGDAIRKAGDYIKDMGLSMSELDVAKVESAAGSFDGFRDSTKALSQNFAASFAPVIEAVNNALLDMSKELGGVSGKTDDVVDGLVKGFGYVADAVDGAARVVQYLGIGIGGLAAIAAQTKDAVGLSFDSIADSAKSALQLSSPVGMAGGFIYKKFFGDDKEQSQIKQGSDAIKGIFSDMLKDFDALLQKEQPSAKIIAEFEKAKKASNDAAQKMLDDRKKYQYGFEASNDEEIDGNKKVQQTYLELLATYDNAVAAGYRYQQAIEAINDSAATYEEKLHLITLAQQKFNEALAEPEEQSYWQKWLEGAEKALSSFDEMAKSVIDNFSSGMGSAFEQMVFDATTFEDAMKNLAVNMARSIVNALGQMAGQWLAYQAVQAMVGKQAQASAMSAMVANAQAGVFQSAINAFSSTAAIPIVGPAAAPAAAAAATAFTQPFATSVQSMALMGMAHDGIDSVPREGTWLLDKGERVMTSETSAKLDRTLDNLAGGSAANDSRNMEVSLRLDSGLVMENLRNDDDFERTVVNIMRRNS